MTNWYCGFGSRNLHSRRFGAGFLTSRLPVQIPGWVVGCSAPIRHRIAIGPVTCCQLFPCLACMCVCVKTILRSNPLLLIGVCAGILAQVFDYFFFIIFLYRNTGPTPEPATVHDSEIPQTLPRFWSRPAAITDTSCSPTKVSSLLAPSTTYLKILPGHRILKTFVKPGKVTLTALFPGCIWRDVLRVVGWSCTHRTCFCQRFCRLHCRSLSNPTYILLVFAVSWCCSGIKVRNKQPTDSVCHHAAFTAARAFSMLPLN